MMYGDVRAEFFNSGWSSRQQMSQAKLKGFFIARDIESLLKRVY